MMKTQEPQLKNATQRNELLLLRSQALALSRAASNSGWRFSESAAFTSTTALLSISLTVFTLFALYTALQNIPATTAQ